MSWDPVLLRKYTTTAHLKLLSQVRNELREQPIQRPLVTSRSKAAGSPAARRGGGRSATTAPAPAPAPASSSPQPHNLTRRRSTAAAVSSAPVHQEHEQLIMTVPVLMDPSLHGHP